MNKVLTNAKFVNFLRRAEARTDTVYNNSYPKNVGYYDGSRISWDCWNLYKSIIWSKGEVVSNFTKGRYYAKGSEQAPYSGLGDWTDDGIYAACYDRGSSFSDLTPGEALFVRLDLDHSGIYVGTFTDRTGQICNTIECTVAWGRNCVTGSWVDPDGTRRRCKGGARAANAWALHGKLPCIKYVDQKEEEFDVSTIKTVKQGVSGGEVGTLQILLNAKNNAGLYVDNYCGPITAEAIGAYQKKRGLYVDKECGPITWADIINK